MSERQTGVVKWFNTAKGWGFITSVSGDDVFVHYREIRGDGFKNLEEGQKVEFSVVESQKGLTATDVYGVD
ncbi:MAG: cold shock domain-containing protein [Desulfobulbaceae bacterium]|nr:cold shock domain-containing protein [Desulfobulbaceae bacterium]